MNRCVRRNPKLFDFSGIARRAALQRLLAGAGMAALAMLAAPAYAGLRGFPVNTQRGQITFANPPQVALDGQSEMLGPGTRVHDTSNRLVFANTLKGQSFTVNYVRDGNRTIREIWILTPEEIGQQLPLTQEQFTRMQQWQRQQNQNAAGQGN